MRSQRPLGLGVVVSDPDAQSPAGSGLLDSDGNEDNPKHNEARHAAACIGGSWQRKSEKPTVNRGAPEGPRGSGGESDGTWGGTGVPGETWGGDGGSMSA